MWDGECFKPVSAFWSRRADRQFVVGQKYQIEARQERNDAAHRAYFAAVREAFMNLPAEYADRFPNDEALRKFALIKAGYANERSIVCASTDEAKRMAAFIEPIDTLSIVVPLGDIVTVYTAKSQSYRAMDRKTFNESKERVLSVIAQMIGVTVEQLKGSEAA